MADEIRRVSLAAFEAAGCEGLARVYYLYTEQGDVILNEINTMPGFTPLSMYPRVWAASGLDYPHLIDELIQLALAAYRPALIAYWQCRTPWGMAAAALPKAGSSSGSGLYALGTKTSIAGERP